MLHLRLQAVFVFIFAGGPPRRKIGGTVILLRAILRLQFNKVTRLALHGPGDLNDRSLPRQSGRRGTPNFPR